MTSNKRLLFTALVVANGMIAQAQKSAQLLLANPTSFQRDDELIVISRKQLEKKAGIIPASKYLVVKDKNNQPLIVQQDDKNGDAIWDEIVLLQSFKPFEKKALAVSFSNVASDIQPPVRSHVRHRRKNTDHSFGPLLEKDSILAGQPATDFSKQALPPFLTEGPAWENDKVGFRIYFDVRNTKDIWGKTTPRMVLNEVGADPSKNYHQLSEWGMDVLKVGKSLGAGGLALQVRQANGQDTLIRLGGVNMGKVIYEKVADGPLRATLRLQYPQWEILDHLPPLSVIEEISIWGGQYFYESRIEINGAPKNARLVTGIVNLHSKQSHLLDTTGSMLLYSYDTQTENNDQLGMAILMDKQHFYASTQTPIRNTEVVSSYTMAATISPKLPVLFRFYAGWEKTDPTFVTEQGFKDYLIKQAVIRNHPITCLIK
jgi:hypothetical protein